jgi:hypothetical protein
MHTLAYIVNVIWGGRKDKQSIFSYVLIHGKRFFGTLTFSSAGSSDVTIFCPLFANSTFDLIKCIGYESYKIAGLPDGSFSNQKSQFGSILEGLSLENVDIFYGHWKYFTGLGMWYFMTIFYILCSYGIFSGLGIIYKEKSGNPGRLCPKTLSSFFFSNFLFNRLPKVPTYI